MLKPELKGLEDFIVNTKNQFLLIEMNITNRLENVK